MRSNRLRSLFLLDPEIVFLNHASFGACPRPVMEVYQHWQRELELEPVDFLVRHGAELMAEARERLAEYVGAGRDDLVFVPNATYGVNVIARSLRLGPGDECLSTDHEYGACDRAWQMLCDRQGATYVRAPIEVPVTTDTDIVEAVWSRVTERTKVLFFSHITSLTALTLPAKALCARARDAGILTLVDGAHVPGHIDLDVPDIGADFYVGNCHKWLCAPKGAGFLWAAPAVQDLVEPLVISFGTHPERPGPSRFVDDLEYTGTTDLASYLSVPAAIDFQAQNDWEAVRGQCHGLLRETRSRLLQIPGIAPLSPDNTMWYGQMAALELPAMDDPLALCETLFSEFGIEVPAYAWNGRPLIRVAIQGYNTPEDIDELMAALEVVMD